MKNFNSPFNFSNLKPGDFGIAFLNVEGFIESWDENISKISGYEANEIIGKNISILFPSGKPGNLYFREHLIEKAREIGKAVYKDNIRKKDGTDILAYLEISAQYGADFKISGFIIIIREIANSEFNINIGNSIPEPDANKDEHFLQSLLEHSQDGVAILNASGKSIYLSKSVESILGFKCGELLNKNFRDILHSDFSEGYSDLFSKLIANQDEFTKTYQVKIKHKDGTWRWIEGTFSNKLDDPEIKGIINNFRDITAIKIAEEQMLQANRISRFLSQVNQTIIRADNEQTLFREACRLAVEFVGFKAAWIAMINVAEGKINLVEEYGLNPGDIPLFTNRTYEPGGPQDKLVQTGKYFFCNNLENEPGLEKWKQFLNRRHWGAFITLPIKRSGKLIGAFNLSATEQGFFNNEKIAVLEEVAMDISFALDVFEKEKTKKHALGDLHYSEWKLKQATSFAHLGNWELSFQKNTITWSEEQCKIFGVPLAENIQTIESWLEFVLPEDKEKVKLIIKNKTEHLTTGEFDYRIIRKDGNIRHLFTESHLVLDDNSKPIAFHGTSCDITQIKETEEQLKKANRLLTFRNQLNQAIALVREEKTLFDEVCRYAVDFGKFEMALITKPERESRKLKLIAHNNAQPDDIAFFNNLVFDEQGANASIFKTGRPYSINNFAIEQGPLIRKNYAKNKGFQSYLVLPLKKSGLIEFTLHLFSATVNFFNPEEIRLLEEAAKDISFTLDVFENEKLKKEAEEKLKQSEARLKNAQNIAHFGNWEYDFSTGNVILSEEICRIGGIPLDEYIQPYETWISLIHPEDRANFDKIINEALINHTQAILHHRIISRNGHIRHLHSWANIEFNPNGEPIALFGVVHDITEIRETENELNQLQVNLGLIMDLMPVGIFVRDSCGKFVMANKAFAGIYNLEPEQLVGKYLTEAITDNPEYFLAQDRMVILSGQKSVFPEVSLTVGGGKQMIFHITKLPFILPGSNEKAILAIVIDITEQKATERERNKMIADYIMRTNDLEQFSYIVSHNLRAPVANIIGLTNLLGMGYESQDKIKEMTKYLSESANKLDSVIKDINYVLQVKHQVNEKRELVKFADLIDEINISIATLLKNEDAEISCDFTTVSEIFTIKNYLFSILFHLISNSIKYRRPGIKPVIEIRTGKDGKLITLWVSDNGLGFDLNKRKEQIFGLYKRFHEHTEGRGIGLFMVKTRVEALGGNITVESEVNKGTKFKMTFENL